MPVRLAAALLAIPALLVLLVLLVFAARRRCRWLIALVAPGLLATPLLLPADALLLRFVGGCLALLVLFKGVDLALAPGAASGVGAWLAYLANPFALVLRRLDQEPRPPRRASLLAAARSFGVALLGLGPAAWAFRTDALARWFLLEHVVRVSLAYVVAIGALNGAAWLVRAAGGRARAPFDAPFLAVTPADFWRRYNRIVGQALQENVWRPLGGRRAPARGALLTFVVSAAMHEYVFGVALGVQGYQTAFFLLQGAAVAATLRVRPRGAGAVAGVGLTFAFNMLTGVLFMASAHQVLPVIYTRAALP